LRSRGHDAVLLDYVCAQTNKTEWRCAMQPLLPRRSPREAIRLYARKARAFEAAVDALPVSDRFPLAEPELMQDCDVVVIGSDEVWNLSHPWFGGNPLFWGHGLRAPRLISYAASFGNYDADAGIDSFWSSQLRNFHRISVRDDNSRRLVQAALDLEPVMVLDPVLQFPPELDESSGWSERAPYAVLYGHSFSDDFARAIRAWADRRGLPLVSLGYVNDWADEQCIDADPIAFAHAMSQAQSVVTNFFHGCVFALVNDKPFACEVSAYRMNKVRDLTTALSAEHHLLRGDDEPERFAQVLDQPLAPKVAGAIERLRRQSESYLQLVAV